MVEPILISLLQYPCFFSVHAERDGEQRNYGSGLLHHRQTVSQLSPGPQCISHEPPPILRNFPHCFPGMGKNTRHFFNFSLIPKFLISKDICGTFQPS